MSEFDVVMMFVPIVLTTILALKSVPILVWMERRGAGLIQDRLGPNRCHIFGVKLGGIVQSVADVVKFVFKEEYLPAHIRNRYLYLLAPTIVFSTAYLTFTVIPFADSITLGDKTYRMQAMPIELGALWFLAFAGLSVYGIIIAGWASQNKFGLLGGIRASAQVVSYEASLGLSLLTMIIVYGSVYLNDMVRYQGNLLFGVVPMWGIVLQPLAAVIFIVTAFAETNRAPFDSAEGESEIVAGYHTEYGAMRFALFMLGEYLAMAASSALIVTLFFGGYQIPWFNTETLRENIEITSLVVMIATPLIAGLFWKWARKNLCETVCTVPSAYAKHEYYAIAFLTLLFVVVIESVFGLTYLSGYGTFNTQVLVALIQLGVFSLKFFIMNFVFVWVRWTLPRFRYDQLQMLGWRVLLPLSLANIAVTTIVVVLLEGF
jgi:NADH-quinone oxidoreductase subunit H